LLIDHIKKVVFQALKGSAEATYGCFVRGGVFDRKTTEPFEREAIGEGFFNLFIGEVLEGLNKKDFKHHQRGISWASTKGRRRCTGGEGICKDRKINQLINFIKDGLGRKAFHEHIGKTFNSYFLTRQRKLLNLQII
jgi:hypothetical protein